MSFQKQSRSSLPQSSEDIVDQTNTCCIIFGNEYLHSKTTPVRNIPSNMKTLVKAWRYPKGSHGNKLCLPTSSWGAWGPRGVPSRIKSKGSKPHYRENDGSRESITENLDLSVENSQRGASRRGRSNRGQALNSKQSDPNPNKNSLTRKRCGKSRMEHLACGCALSYYKSGEGTVD